MSSVPEVSSSRRLPSLNSSSASVSATWAFTDFFPLSSLLGQFCLKCPFWWQLKHSTSLHQSFVSSSVVLAQPLVPFLQLLDRVLSAHVSMALGFGVGILTPKIQANSWVEIFGFPPMEVFFGVSSNIPLMFWNTVLS